MTEAALSQDDIDTLNKDYAAYIEGLRRTWLQPRWINSKDVYEVMPPSGKAEVQGVISAWNVYITPRAEAWWRERGFGVKWPDDDSKPMQVFRLP